MDTTDTDALKQQVKQLLVDNLMLQCTADQITNEIPLFGPDSLGLDSVDALQLVVALEKAYGVKISDSDAARKVLKNVNSIVETVERHLKSKV